MGQTGQEPLDAPDLTACDREPIHVPGSIQPHGLLLVADADTHRVVAGAGALEAVFGPDWLGAEVDALVRQDLRAAAGGLAAGPGGTLPAETVTLGGREWDVAVHRGAKALLVELEPAPEEPLRAGQLLGWLDMVAQGFERAIDLQALCVRAAQAFRQLTGFDRVMIYRFLDDEAGRVVAEDAAPGQAAFLHHHFPATDIPRQARALYVRNRTRAIPDVGYRPAPLRPAGHAGLDLSDVALRSVSPIHVQYLKNMGVGASASISIVKDGLLWGLIACHNQAPRQLPRDVRGAAATLASGLARQVKAKEEAEAYRDRLRLRAAEDAVAPRVAAASGLPQAVRDTHEDLRAMLGGDGLALVAGGLIEGYGACPPAPAIAELARWARTRDGGEPVATHHLSALLPQAEAWRREASGLLALPLPEEEAVLLWFRTEQVEEVEWAGNPHKAVPLDPHAILTPRASFQTWVETVRGRSRRWTLEEVEAARRLRRALADAQASRRLRALSESLQRTVADKDALLAQKDLLMKEVDHRVQNSLQLVSAFLAMQMRAAGPGPVTDSLAEAQSRLTAVALVHRRLYRDDQIATVNLARYLEDLTADLKGSLGRDWAKAMRVDLAPVLIPTDRAVSLGLIATELVINATKYAYGGAPGPIDIALEQHRQTLRLIVADQGRGATGAVEGGGFGSRMMRALIARLGGELDLVDNAPGLRAVLTAPIEEQPR
jgi:light-regulated signal transduction histidine kinase (bacteriophytochrome)